MFFRALIEELLEYLQGTLPDWSAVWEARIPGFLVRILSIFLEMNPTIRKASID